MRRRFSFAKDNLVALHDPVPQVRNFGDIELKRIPEDVHEVTP